ncbi:bifunctional protein tyrosine phosphatase family protein/NAD(P)/FAD-dependent oxidoreductase [Hyphomicrobium sulfonivorans]|uniref:bifunctional protein tyrosine phosphatase family protein/NAD(P)/FAD-dependent oxidoreductase n=1 Tax=Hyphomicrobium sulfonivorans TaxID=121290 RepID=UPI001570D651|nr:bifunctional protein tyrosine phosphatase family protein/NAD(P)/FAD-dependent oxidoreductase [Hyphomicrobium sulfonivorans]MBI1649206.1 TIGR01244 family phosphatase [Hyphomicrobium sulfonivorans]NSL70263.1 TIGR01244 family phosphatase [Hyphomicrobium sulfonivorans]
MAKELTGELSVAGQISPAEMTDLAADGFRSIICNRPDGEGADQPSFAEIAAAAAAAGLQARYVPITAGQVSDADATAFAAALTELPKPVLAYCRSGTRSTILWAMTEAGKRPADDIVNRARLAGYDVTGVMQRVAKDGAAATDKPVASHDIVIVGGGAAGTAVAASLLRRAPDLDIAVIDPAETHYYQPGWTMVGGGIFSAESTAKSMASVLPGRVTWIKAAVASFSPETNSVLLEGCRAIRYNHLIVCPGIKLNWNGVEGLSETLGHNGVTSNYRYDLAPYTWELVRNLKSGKAIFTQPPMPIKCAGAPQKAMYLSADHWLRTGHLKDIDVSFYNAGGVLFGVPEYVPALMNYVERYNAQLKFNHNLIAIDGPAQRAWFKKTGPDGATETVETSFDMIHVCPPQLAPDFIRASPLADSAGWIDVDHATLRHKRFANIYGLGDAACTPNAKTAAAARKQAPVVAENILCDKGRLTIVRAYDGYGSCPLTVERGKIVLAEFCYGGKVTPTFPRFVIDGMKPSRTAWLLKARLLPPIYWRAMLKGREWLAKPKDFA